MVESVLVELDVGVPRMPRGGLALDNRARDSHHLQQPSKFRILGER